MSHQEGSSIKKSSKIKTEFFYQEKIHKLITILQIFAINYIRSRS